jgi:hypothetical protein
MGCRDVMDFPDGRGGGEGLEEKRALDQKRGQARDPDW